MILSWKHDRDEIICREFASKENSGWGGGYKWSKISHVLEITEDGDAYIGFITVSLLLYMFEILQNRKFKGVSTKGRKCYENINTDSLF